MSVTYKALVALDHTADHCIYPAGALVKLDHLSKEQVKLLVERGYVQVADTEAKAEAKAEADGKK